MKKIFLLKDPKKLLHVIDYKKDIVDRTDFVPEWSELDLAWDGSQTKNDGHVLFAEFKKNAD